MDGSFWLIKRDERVGMASFLWIYLSLGHFVRASRAVSLCDVQVYYLVTFLEVV